MLYEQRKNDIRDAYTISFQYKFKARVKDLPLSLGHKRFRSLNVDMGELIVSSGGKDTHYGIRSREIVIATLLNPLLIYVVKHFDTHTL
jgi:hypothetical protein